jgi:Chlorophyll A-B binding protein
MQQNNNPELMDASVRNAWIWGFTPQAEIWNGRLAMIGFVSALLIEVLSHRGVLQFWGILSSGAVPVT